MTRSSALLLFVILHLVQSAGAAISPADLIRRELTDRAVTGLIPIYEKFDFRPLWHPSDAQTRWFLRTLVESASEGLAPERYHTREIARLWRKLASGPTPDQAARLQARLDVLLSQGFVDYGTDLSGGILSPAGVRSEWGQLQSSVEQDGSLAQRALEKAAKSGNFIEALGELAPADPDYQPLKKHLARLREWNRTGGWPVIPRTARLYRGKRGPEVALLKWRLSYWIRFDSQAAHGLPPAPSDAVFDAELERELVQFQSAHGLEADGRLGPATRAALNVPVKQRIEQVEVNLERLRWLPRQLSGVHLIVDIAKFMLELRTDGSTQGNMRIIVGEMDWKTPVFSSQITELQLNPSWYIPVSILSNEIAPNAARDPRYLRDKSIQVLKNGKTIPEDQVDWDEALADNSPYKFIQPPSPDNPLGSIKFIFPNPHAIYLHGTTDPALFEKKLRAFSHGCIRVEKPVELAAELLKIANTDRTPKVSELQSWIESGKTRDIKLEKPVPIYLIYRTAWMDPDGRLSFRPDIYGWDKVVAQALVIQGMR